MAGILNADIVISHKIVSRNFVFFLSNIDVMLSVIFYSGADKILYACSSNTFLVVYVRSVVERPPVQDFGTISQDSEIIQSTSAGRNRAVGGTPRPKRRSSGGGGSRSRSTSKKQRMEETSTPAQPVMKGEVYLYCCFGVLFNW